MTAAHNIISTLHDIGKTLYTYMTIYICANLRVQKAGQVINMLSIAVCDDEIIACCNIAAKIKEILEQMKISCVIRQFNSGQELLHSSERFDLVFLDIIMSSPDGMTTARLLRRKTPDLILIFISSSREYVFDAYDVEAFQYLLKPVDPIKLRNVLQKVIRKTENHSYEYMIVSRERQSRKLRLDDIYYFEIRGRKIDIHTTDGILTYYEQIGILEKQLRDKGFFRCHKSYLVNLKYVDTYNRQEIILDNGDKITIAKRRYDDFIKEILSYMKKSGGIV